MAQILHLWNVCLQPRGVFHGLNTLAGLLFSSDNVFRTLTVGMTSDADEELTSLVHSLKRTGAAMVFSGTPPLVCSQCGWQVILCYTCTEGPFLCDEALDHVICSASFVHPVADTWAPYSAPLECPPSWMRKWWVLKWPTVFLLIASESHSAPSVVPR